MRKFINFVAGALMFASVSTANAQTATATTAIDPKTIDCQHIDISKYDGQQVESIRNLCAQTQVQAEKITPQDVREWASLGKDFGQAVTETAKGLGVAVNEFLFTPVGFMLAFYFMWDMIGGVIVGIPLLFGIWYLYFRICRVYVYKNAKYEYVPVLFGLFTRKKIVEENIEKPSDAATAMLLFAIPAVFLSMLDIGTLIF